MAVSFCLSVGAGSRENCFSDCRRWIRLEPLPSPAKGEMDAFENLHAKEEFATPFCSSFSFYQDSSSIDLTKFHILYYLFEILASSTIRRICIKLFTCYDLVPICKQLKMKNCHCVKMCILLKLWNYSYNLCHQKLKNWIFHSLKICSFYEWQFTISFIFFFYLLNFFL